MHQRHQQGFNLLWSHHSDDTTFRLSLNQQLHNTEYSRPVRNMSEAKNIIITGASGLVGPLLASRLLNSPEYRLVLTDLHPPILPPNVTHPSNATLLQGDITSPAFITTLLTAAQPLHAIFLFHGIMSAGSEEDYDLSLKVNVDSIRLITDQLRLTNPGCRVIYASSQAVFGQPLPRGKITDDVLPTPESTYGCHKLMTESYLTSLHRKGFLDVFIARFPTISVRPGRPTAAASSFLSGIIREPMRGVECVVPIEDRGFKSFLASPRTIAENLVRVLGLGSGCLPVHRRVIQFPGVSVSVQEMMDALGKFGGEDKLGLVKEVRDEGLERILRSWPTDFDLSTAERLGLVVDEGPGAEGIVGEYVRSLGKV
ncbi:Putative protein of unknown function [Podospora comata]|uniref:NAD-dependent epimerase/dehydratase domain-containing protein n=1 Tax=Podospora comata TaxID=48703 RepID=A0ABY6S7P9_PODCO|nr:Putative protein of unknown function [Podospora comata]